MATSLPECPVCLETVQLGETLVFWCERHPLCLSCANTMYERNLRRCPLCREAWEDPDILALADHVDAMSLNVEEAPFQAFNHGDVFVIDRHPNLAFENDDFLSDLTWEPEGLREYDDDEDWNTTTAEFEHALDEEEAERLSHDPYPMHVFVD